jgi:hypothetical protein
MREKTVSILALKPARAHGVGMIGGDGNRRCGSMGRAVG